MDTCLLLRQSGRQARFVVLRWPPSFRCLLPSIDTGSCPGVARPDQLMERPGEALEVGDVDNGGEEEELR